MNGIMMRKFNKFTKYNNDPNNAMANGDSAPLLFLGNCVLYLFIFFVWEIIQLL